METVTLKKIEFKNLDEIILTFKNINNEFKISQTYDEYENGEFELGKIYNVTFNFKAVKE